MLTSATTGPFGEISPFHQYSPGFITPVGRPVGVPAVCAAGLGIAEARLNRRKAHDEARDTRQRLATDVLSLLEELQRQGQLLDLATKQAELYGERLRVVRAKFEAGAATPAEVLEREVDLVQARTKAVQARYERWRVLAILCLLSGQELKCLDAS